MCGGHDGLNAYRIIANEAKDYLKKNGFLLVEVGSNQSKKVKKIFELKKFTTVCISKDFLKNERVIIFKK